MSTEQNRALILRFAEEAFNAASMATFDELVAEDVVDHLAAPDSPSGREGWRQNRQAFLAAFPDGRWEVADIIADGDLVAVRTPFSGTHLGAIRGLPATGRRVAIGGIHICRIVDGRIVEHWGNNDDLGLLRQIGAIPTPDPAAA
jgi:steroid delta-isomerase-like uncharacterized protein